MPFIDTRDGTRLFVDDWGEGEPIVFVSSAWLSSRMWELQLPFLVEKGYRCIAYDRRGHGRSDWPFHGYDYDTLADDLASILDALDLRDVTLVAHSMGGGEAIRYLSRHGTRRVARVALVGATAPFPMSTADNDAVPRELGEADAALRASDRPKWMNDNADAFFGIGLPGISVSPEMRQWMITQCLDCSPRASHAAFLSAFTTDFRREMREITIPALVVHGENDQQAPIVFCGERSAALIPHARFVRYENAAHGLFLTHAARLNADLLAFVGG